MYEKTIFNIRLDNLLAKYDEYHRIKIKQEIKEILEISGDNTLDFNLVAMIIFNYFKFNEKV